MNPLFRNIIILLLSTVVLGCAGMDKKNENTPERKLAETQVRLGIGYMQKGEMKIALEKLQKAIDTDPSMAAAHSALALLYTQLEQFDKADKHYRKAVRLTDNDSNIYNNYGTFLCSQKRFKEAYKQFEKAVENTLYRTPERAFENAGLCALREPNLEYAEQSFRKALKIDPKLPVSLITMADLLYRKKAYLQARAYIQRFEDVASHAAETLWLAAKIEQNMGAADAAERYANRLKKEFPDSPLIKQLTE